MTVHCASLKNYYEGTSFKMPKFNLKLFKTLIQTSRMFIPNVESKVVLSFIRNANCLSKEVNSPPIRQFPSFSIFGHVTCHVTIKR